MSSADTSLELPPSNARTLSDQARPSYRNFPTSYYRVDFYMRARAPHHTATSTNEQMDLPPGAVCTLHVRDAGQCRPGHDDTLCSKVLQPSDFSIGNHWSLISLEFCLSNPLNALDLGVEWHGNASLDIVSVAICHLNHEI